MKGLKNKNDFIKYISTAFGSKPFQIKDIPDHDIRLLMRRFVCYGPSQPNKISELFVGETKGNGSKRVKTYRLKNGGV